MENFAAPAIRRVTHIIHGVGKFPCVGNTTTGKRGLSPFLPHLPLPFGVIFRADPGPRIYVSAKRLLPIPFSQASLPPSLFLFRSIVIMETIILLSLSLFLAQTLLRSNLRDLASLPPPSALHLPPLSQNSLASRIYIRSSFSSPSLFVSIADFGLNPPSSPLPASCLRSPAGRWRGRASGRAREATMLRRCGERAYIPFLARLSRSNHRFV